MDVWNTGVQKMHFAVADDHYFTVLNDTCYLLITYEFETYNVAQSKSRDNGGELAMPKTEDVNDFLVWAISNPPMECGLECMTRLTSVPGSLRTDQRSHHGSTQTGLLVPASLGMRTARV